MDLLDGNILKLEDVIHSIEKYYGPELKLQNKLKEE
jgi:hypothetical protein